MLCLAQLNDVSRTVKMGASSLISRFLVWGKFVDSYLLTSLFGACVYFL